MPIYEYYCEECDDITEVITYRIGDGPAKESVCKWCGNKAELAVSVPSMRPDDMWNGHYSVSLGKHFNSRREYNDYCKRNGYEASGARDQGAVESARRTREYKNQKQKKARTEHVAKHVREFMA